MKNFITCFTLFLMANLAHGQIGSFNFNDGALISTFAVGVAGTNSSASITSISSVAADCAGTASIGRSVTGASATISLTIAPASGYTGLVTFTGIAITLKHDKNAATIGTATVVVNGNPFLGALTFSNTCSTLNFAGGPLDAVTAGSIAIVINISYNNASSKILTFDDIAIDGSVAFSVLPVELTKFNVKKTEQSVMLAWATASEKNNDHFDIQKSTNGTQFQTIGQVKGSGTNLSGASYNFEDKNPSVGIAYYRLKQVDSDGKYEFSSVRSIMFGKSKIAVFSTIAKDRISLTVSDDQIVPFDIINLNGQKVLAGKAIGQYTIDVSSLHSGMYFIRTEGGEVTRFVKE